MLFWLHRYIVTSLHRYIVTSLHRYIVTSLHRYIVTSLHRYIVTSLHRYIVTSLHRYIVTSLHRYIVTSLHRYIVTSLHRYIVTSLHRYIVTSLHRYIVTSLHRYIVTSLHRYIVTSLHRYIVTSLHRYIVTSLHRYIVTSLHRYIVTSLHRYIVTSLHRYIVTSLHRYIVTSLHRYIVTSLHRYIVTSLHRYIVTSLHRYIVTSLHRYNLLIFNTPPAPRFHGGSKRANALYGFLFTRQVKKPSSKAQTCGLPQSISRWLLHCVQIRTRFEHGFFTCTNNKAFIIKPALRCISQTLFLFSHLFFLPLSFPRKRESRSSFLRQPSFPRRRESSMHFVSLTAIKLWVQGVCQKKHPLGARRWESRKSLLCDEVHYVKIQSGNFFVRRFAWTQKKFPFVFLLIIRTAKRCIRNNPLCRVVIFVLSMGFSLAQIRNYLRSFLYA